MGYGSGTASDAPLVLLSGGGGGARLAAGLSQASDERRLLVVTNTGDDFEHCGLSICPDTDSVLYAVSKTIDPQRGWGRAEESWSVFEALKNLGGPDWFQLGDKDLALHLSRAAMLAAGKDVAGVTTVLGDRLGVPPHVTVVPATVSLSEPTWSVTRARWLFRITLLRIAAHPFSVMSYTRGLTRPRLLSD